MCSAVGALAFPRARRPTAGFMPCRRARTLPAPMNGSPGAPAHLSQGSRQSLRRRHGRAAERQTGTRFMGPRRRSAFAPPAATKCGSSPSHAQGCAKRNPCLRLCCQVARSSRNGWLRPFDTAVPPRAAACRPVPPRAPIPLPLSLPPPLLQAGHICGHPRLEHVAAHGGVVRHRGGAWVPGGGAAGSCRHLRELLGKRGGAAGAWQGGGAGAWQEDGAGDWRRGVVRQGTAARDQGLGNGTRLGA